MHTSLLLGRMEEIQLPPHRRWGVHQTFHLFSSRGFPLKPYSGKARGMVVDTYLRMGDIGNGQQLGYIATSLASRRPWSGHLTSSFSLITHVNRIWMWERQGCEVASRVFTLSTLYTHPVPLLVASKSPRGKRGIGCFDVIKEMFISLGWSPRYFWLCSRHLQIAAASMGSSHSLCRLFNHHL